MGFMQCWITYPEVFIVLSIYIYFLSHMVSQTWFLTPFGTVGLFLQNMIDGLGITGYEGIFLRVCEITLSVLRTHRETLMSVLETFIHDPLVEWTKSHKSSGVEVQNPHAQVPLFIIHLSYLFQV